jgi:hypothetical protein
MTHVTVPDGLISFRDVIELVFFGLIFILLGSS